jgi:hypothetical protein
MLALMVTELALQGPLGAAHKTLLVFATASDPQLRVSAHAIVATPPHTIMPTASATNRRCIRRDIAYLARDSLVGTSAQSSKRTSNRFTALASKSDA